MANGRDPEVSQETKHARWMLGQSERALEDILVAFEEMRRQILEGGTLTGGDLTRARVSLGHTRSQLLDEVNKYERHILLSNGLTAEAPLNFDAIKRGDHV
ncbi:MAG: hypothetical protein ABJI00_06010 [Paracoccaceae bacterium]